MELIEDFETGSLYSFLRDMNEKKAWKIMEKQYGKIVNSDDFDEFDNVIDFYMSDADGINQILEEIYPNNKYFIVIDFIEENMGSFRIRVCKK